jgi:hypothetical protein
MADIVDGVDEGGDMLHNLVSLLRTQRFAALARPKIFNNQQSISVGV